jgi:hypothetical protein
MLLRKSPGRTPGLLTVNRGNEQKSIRPRTREGKNRVRPSPRSVRQASIQSRNVPSFQ